MLLRFAILATLLSILKVSAPFANNTWWALTNLGLKINKALWFTSLVSKSHPMQMKIKGRKEKKKKFKVLQIHLAVN